MKNRIRVMHHGLAALTIGWALSLSGCTTANPVPYQKPQIDAKLRVVGWELPKLPKDATQADVLLNRIESDRIVVLLDAQIRAILNAVGVESIEWGEHKE